MKLKTFTEGQDHIRPKDTGLPRDPDQETEHHLKNGIKNVLLKYTLKMVLFDLIGTLFSKILLIIFCLFWSFVYACLVENIKIIIIYGSIHSKYFEREIILSPKILRARLQKVAQT